MCYQDDDYALPADDNERGPAGPTPWRPVAGDVVHCDRWPEHDDHVTVLYAGEQSFFGRNSAGDEYSYSYRHGDASYYQWKLVPKPVGETWIAYHPNGYAVVARRKPKRDLYDAVLHVMPDRTVEWL